MSYVQPRLLAIAVPIKRVLMYVYVCLPWCGHETCKIPENYQNNLYMANRLQLLDRNES